MTAEPLAANAAIHPLFARLFSQHGYAQLEAAGVDAFVGPPGHALLFFSEEGLRVRVEVHEDEGTRSYLGRLIRLQRMSESSTGLAIEFDPEVDP